MALLFHFFLLHDKKAAKHVVLRRNFKVSKIDLARCFTFETVCLYRVVSQKREEEMRYERREKISKRVRLHLVQTQ